jgi:hypothetical protein
VSVDETRGKHETTRIDHARVGRRLDPAATAHGNN